MPCLPTCSRLNQLFFFFFLSPDFTRKREIAILGSREFRWSSWPIYFRYCIFTSQLLFCTNWLCVFSFFFTYFSYLLTWLVVQCKLPGRSFLSFQRKKKEQFAPSCAQEAPLGHAIVESSPYQNKSYKVDNTTHEATSIPPQSKGKFHCIGNFHGTRPKTLQETGFTQKCVLLRILYGSSNGAFRWIHSIVSVANVKQPLVSGWR